MIPGIPDIPGFKGLPSAGAGALVSFGGAFIINKIFGEQWGVYSQFGIPILLADTVESVGYQNSSTIASAPVEKGSFASYNKVQNPYTSKVTLTKGGGSAAERGLFIGQLDTLSKSTLLFHIVTPDYVHLNAAIVGFDYSRSATNGSRIIVANLLLQEVREVVVSYESEETENPEDSDTEDDGEKEPEEQSFLSEAAEKAQEIGQKALDIYNGAIDAASDLATGVIDSVSDSITVGS